MLSCWNHWKTSFNDTSGQFSARKANRMTDWGQILESAASPPKGKNWIYDQMNITNDFGKLLKVGCNIFFSSSRKETILLMECNCAFFFSCAVVLLQGQKHLANGNDESNYTEQAKVVFLFIHSNKKVIHSIPKEFQRNSCVFADFCHLFCRHASFIQKNSQGTFITN